MSDELYARRSVVAMLVLMAVVHIPILMTTAVFGDDWAWVWVDHFQGAAVMQEYTWQFAHPGYGPLFNLAFWLGGEYAGHAARAAAVATYLGSGWMLWRIFVLGRTSAAFAATVAILYLASPFLGGLRGTFSHFIYDIFIFFYLVSIRYSADRRIGAIAGAVVAQFVGLLLETLIVLEVLRWWFVYRNGYRGRGFARQLLPFCVVALAVVVSRATWLKPYGEIWGQHNALKMTGVPDLIFQAALHVYYYIHAVEPVRYVASLLAYENALIGLVLVVAAAGVGALFYRVHDQPKDRDLAIIAAVGIVIFGLGMLPYVAAQRPPVWVNTYSRLAVASQFGAYILIACFVHCLRGRATRAIALGGFVFICAAVQFQFGKWMIYDQFVVRDLRRQLGDHFKSEPPQLLIVRFPQDSHEVFYIKRCLANYDINAALDIDGNRHGSYAYDYDCDADVYTKEGKCGVTAFDLKPCPALRKTAEFRLRPEMERFTRVRLFDLGRQLLAGTPVQTGTLVVDQTVKTPASAGATR